jgi:hypothetical protein
MKTTIVLTVFVLAFSSIVFGQTDIAVVKLNDTINLEMYRIPFDSTGKHFELNNNLLLSINGASLFGTDGDYPKYQLSKAVLHIGHRTYQLQVDNMYNPWFGEIPFEKSFKLKIDGSYIKIKGIFSDGAGSYGAEWTISGLSSIRTILSNDEQIMIDYILSE